MKPKSFELLDVFDYEQNMVIVPSHYNAASSGLMKSIMRSPLFSVWPLAIVLCTVFRKLFGIPRNLSDIIFDSFRITLTGMTNFSHWPSRSFADIILFVVLDDNRIYLLGNVIPEFRHRFSPRNGKKNSQSYRLCSGKLFADELTSIISATIFLSYSFRFTKRYSLLLVHTV